MDTQDILRATQSTKRLIQDDNYYKYIFKKTERIVSVVFYITHSLKEVAGDRGQIEDIEHAARRLHDAVLASLQSRAHVAEEVVRETAHALIVLESKLRVAQVSGLLTTEVMNVLGNETDAVLRGVTPYIGEEAVVFDRTEPSMSARKSVSSGRPPAAARAVSAQAPLPPSELSGGAQRQARIKAVIEAQGEVSIKDISAIINDVSEKTIQRELNSMIEDNQLKRIGERRWSKYVIF